MREEKAQRSVIQTKFGPLYILYHASNLAALIFVEREIYSTGFTSRIALFDQCIRFITYISVSCYVNGETDLQNMEYALRSLHDLSYWFLIVIW